MRPTFLILFAAALLFHPLAARAEAGRSVRPAVVPIGGPPSIRIAEKAKGNITRTEWTAATGVKLAGCVPDARVASMSMHFDHSKGKPVRLTAADGTFTREMKELLSKMPDGTMFTVTVEVKDGSGKSWPVPDASFTLVR